MNTRTRVVVALCLIFLFRSSLAAQQLEARVKQHQLRNGMKFLLMERHEAPTISMYILFRVGSAEEEIGKSGLAHMFEHMMFKGTTSIGTRNYPAEMKIMEELERVVERMIQLQAKGPETSSRELQRLQERMKQLMEQQSQHMIKDEFDEIYTRAGGEGLNAFTSNDVTGYVISLPSNKLELWAAMESERMLRPVLREFYLERDVVMEERRLRTDTSPEGKLEEEFFRAAFFAHPYGVPVIGWPSDVQRLSRRDAERFFKTYYGPNNAVAAIVGDIRIPNAIKVIDRYFNRIPRQQSPQRFPPEELEQPGERRIKVEFDANPQLVIGFHKPTYPHADNYVLDVIEDILGYGRTSRFYRNLVEGKQLVLEATASNNEPGERFSNLFVIRATPREPHTTAEVEQAIYQELESLKMSPAAPNELEKVRNTVDADFIRALDSNDGMAFRLSYSEAVYGSRRFLIDYPKKIRAVSADDVMRVAKQYFTHKNRTVGELVKKEATAQ